MISFSFCRCAYQALILGIDLEKFSPSLQMWWNQKKYNRLKQTWFLFLLFLTYFYILDIRSDNSLAYLDVFIIVKFYMHVHMHVRTHTYIYIHTELLPIRYQLLINIEKYFEKAFIQRFGKVKYKQWYFKNQIDVCNFKSPFSFIHFFHLQFIFVFFPKYTCVIHNYSNTACNCGLIAWLHYCLISHKECIINYKIIIFESKFQIRIRQSYCWYQAKMS